MMKKQSYQWLKNGILLGFVAFVAVLLVKPLGISTQFSTTAGILHSAVDQSVIVESNQNASGYASEVEYYDRKDGKMAGDIKKPLTYSMIFAGAMFLGGFISSRIRKTPKEDNEEIVLPKQLSNISSKHQMKVRFLISFVAGFIGLFGARLAGGCTSGHMMSGMMQTALSGYLFALAVFASAIPLAVILYRQVEGGK
ncbi:YeeE/YedE thiosulfate transporter family protein [Bacillus massiliigorillae]|uniref:YeeE/YedE thiosulfate transporter family protein n=1 Tax=Bacillus massiliigorillae TaxID=1243664 RepID=UPI001E5B115E|nr:YeeE/YedE thiosulfate transporter family protein [Bacillus massiliigorillae]